MKAVAGERRVVRWGALLPGFLMVSLVSGQAPPGFSISWTGAPPNPNAALDIDVGGGPGRLGLLIPRVCLTSLNDNSFAGGPLGSNETSLLVYNTGDPGCLPAGFYYWDGTQWRQFLTSANFPAFSCATDNYVLKRSGGNIGCSIIYDDGTNVGIGTASPAVRLDVRGFVRISQNWDNVFQSYQGANLFDLIGTYAGWDATAVYIAGYNAFTGAGGRATTRVHVGRPERVTVHLGSGNVGIGTTTPSTRLHVEGGWLRVSNAALPNSAIQLETRNGFHRIAFNQLRFWDWDVGGDMVTFQNGRVGIRTTAPAQELHVVGDIQFTGDLRPGGNPGLSGQVLRSQGPGAPPVWFPMAGTIVYHNAFYSTGDVCINNSNWTTHPGVSTTISLQAGDIVYVWGFGAAMADNNCNGNSDLVSCFFDVRIAVNGNDFPNGAYTRTSVDNDWGVVVFNSYTVAGRYVAPSSGNYTFALQTRRVGGSGRAITAGDNTSALQSGMIIIVVRP